MYKNKTNIVLTCISLAVLLVVTIIASYAYFTSTANITNNLKMNTTTMAAATFTAYAQDQIELNIGAEDMIEASSSPKKSDAGSIVAKLSSPEEGISVFCTYDIDLVWDTTDQYSAPTTTLSGNYEISLLGSQTVSGDTTGHVYNVNRLTETNLTDFTWSGTVGAVGRKAKVISGAQIYSKSVAETTATWNFTLNFYSLSTDQSSIAGRNFGAHLAVTNVVC